MSSYYQRQQHQGRKKPDQATPDQQPTRPLRPEGERKSESKAPAPLDEPHHHEEHKHKRKKES